MNIDQVLPSSRKGQKKKKGGGFQSMNLSHPVFRAVMKKGYKVPTPIQRKAIPVIKEGKNVVAMARTGSGKTAAFLIPMLEKLKTRVAKQGARALIFSPTRELAVQTSKFTKELAIFTGLKSLLILGGEKIEDQFAAIHESPDIIIATPGRFLHIIVEMDLKLSSVEYVVFDEADKLFELGFQEQLQEVLSRISSERQTLLFSATLPKVLVDFVKLGVDDPVLIRLDVDFQISENLKSSYLLCRPDAKAATLLYLLRNVVNLEKELTVVFLATKHHVEYMKDILEVAGIPCSYIYSSLDPVARTIHIDKFRARKVGVMLVTDIAARGIDIPLLDNVINFNFPAKPKLFVHRVGRVARAGRSGRAFSLIESDEIPYFLDLHLFLGKPVKFPKENSKDEDGLCGSVPQEVIEDEAELLNTWHQKSTDLTNMIKVTSNAYKLYARTRPAPSNESVRRMKKLEFSSAEVHPIFNKDDAAHERNKILAQMKKFRPNTTIFELGPLAKTQANIVMRKKRLVHSKYVKSKAAEASNNDEVVEEKEMENSKKELESADEDDLEIFKHNISKKKNSGSKSTKPGSFRDEENYLSYLPSEHYKEKGLGIENNFYHQASSAVLDFTGDEDLSKPRKRKNHTYWDRKKMKFVQSENVNTKKMKTESGAWIPKSYKSDLYKKWQEKNKVKYQENDANSDEEDRNNNNKRLPGNFKGSRRGGEENGRKMNRPPKRELKNKFEIMKERKKKEKMMDHTKKKTKLKADRQKKFRRR